jgi:hypothetical protein
MAPTRLASPKSITAETRRGVLCDGCAVYRFHQSSYRPMITCMNANMYIRFPRDVALSHRTSFLSTQQLRKPTLPRWIGVSTFRGEAQARTVSRRLEEGPLLHLFPRHLRPQPRPSCLSLSVFLYRYCQFYPHSLYTLLFVLFIYF